MAHMIDFSNDRANIAYFGKTPWHGLGVEMPESADLAEWRRLAGLDWKVLTADVQFDARSTAWGGGVTNQTFDGQQVLYRSDTLAPLSVMTHRYNIHQPAQIVEFFNDLLKDTLFTMETLGSLDGGKRIWGLAKSNPDAWVRIMGTDVVKPYALLTTDFTGKQSTLGSLTSVRTVCNNTLTMALAEIERDQNTGKLRVPHTRTFSPRRAAEEFIDVIVKAKQFEEEAHNLASIGVSDRDAVEFFLNVFGKKDADTGEIAATKPLEKTVTRLLDLYKNGPGAELRSSKGTAWGLVNAVTRYVDFDAPARSDNNRLNSAWFGAGNKKKEKAVEQAFALAA